MGIRSLFRGVQILDGLSSFMAQRAQECPSTLDIICNKGHKSERNIVGFLLSCVAWFLGSKKRNQTIKYKPEVC